MSKAGKSRSGRAVSCAPALEKTYSAACRRSGSPWPPRRPSRSSGDGCSSQSATCKARDAVCRAFADAYVAEGAKLPSETQEARYFDRLMQAYPIHPEVFDRLYEDWTTIDGFQRTRGVLKLMAKVIYRLWKDRQQGPDDPARQPAACTTASSRNELTYYLPPGWDAGDREGHRRRPGRDDGAGRQGAALRPGERGPPRRADAVPRQCPVDRGHEARDPRPRPRPSAARLPSAGTDVVRLLRCAEPARGSAPLPEQLR